MSGIRINKSKIKEISRKGKKENKTKSSFLEFLNKDISFKGGKFNNKKRLNFYSDLYILLSSGLDINTSLVLVGNNLKSKKDKQVIEHIREDIIQGNSLSESVKKSEKFSVYEYYSLKIGEETGKLNDILKELSGFFANRMEQQRKIVNAFSYPFIVILTAFAAIFFMMHFIVPMFEDVFKRYGRELPSITKFVIRMSDNFTGFLLVFLLFIVAFVFLFFVFRNKPWFKAAVSAFLLKLPLFGGLIRKIQLSRFCLFMELMTISKIPLIHAIQLMKKIIRFYPVQHSLYGIEDDIINGSLLYQSMEKYSIYDKRMVSLIKVAEEVNKMGEMFSNLKDKYNKEIEHQTGIISNVMEPVLILFVGLFVGLILVAMYLPMFKLSTGVGF